MHQAQFFGWKIFQNIFRIFFDQFQIIEFSTSLRHNDVYFKPRETASLKRSRAIHDHMDLI